MTPRGLRVSGRAAWNPTRKNSQKLNRCSRRCVKGPSSRQGAPGSAFGPAAWWTSACKMLENHALPWAAIPLHPGCTSGLDAGTQEHPAFAAQPMTVAQVDRGMQGSGTAVGAAQMQPAAAAHPMTCAHNDVRTQGSGDGAGKHKRKASTAQPGEGAPPAMQRLQEQHELSRQHPNSRPAPVPAPGALQPTDQ